MAYGLALGLGFQRLVLLDVGLYGLSLVLEFAALVALRVREPGLPRPFRIPGGTAVVVLLGLPPTALLVVAGVAATSSGGGGDAVGPLGLGAAVVAAGCGVFAIAGRRVGGTH